MHTASSRIQGVFGFFSSALIVLSVVISIVSIIQLNYDGAFNLTSTVSSVEPRFGSADGKAKENCRINFDLDADFSPLFNWNTKQIFVYLTAEYPGKRSDIVNSVTFWDRIITSKEDSHVELRNAKGSYTVYDVAKEFPANNATLRLNWNVQPYIGFLVYGDTQIGGDSSFEFPHPK